MDPLIGRTLSHYEILAEVGRGGMGVVYRAIDLALRREVALKVLPPELVGDPQRHARFIQEAQAASALEHPHIAVIHEIGEAEGVSFIAMELIRGDKLSTVLARERLRLDRVLDLAIEMAEALSRAHERGIIHRDLKPANVMITDEGHAKIIDFGLAKLVETGAGDASAETALLAHTAAGVVVGTTSYMSPEQARGRHVDHRSDIFTFGVLLYEMIAGRSAFGSHTSVDTLNAILNVPAPPLAVADPAVPAEVASELQRIVDKCLEKDPDARFQGMKDLAVDLRAARRRLEGSGAHAPVVSGTMPRLVPVAPASSTRLWIAGVVVLVIGVAASVVMFRGGSSRPAASADATTRPSVAVMYFENNTGIESLDWLRTGLTDLLVTDLSQSPHIEVLGTDRLYQLLSQMRRQNDRVVSFDVVQQIAQRANIDTVVLGSYVRAGDAIRINLKLQEARSGRILATERVDAPREEQLFSAVDELTRRVKAKFDLSGARQRPLSTPGLFTPPRDPLSADRDLREVTTSSMEAYRHYAEGIRLHEGLQEAEAIAPLQAAIRLDPEFALAHAKLSIVYYNLNNLPEANRHASMAIERANRLSPRERYYIEGVYHSRQPSMVSRSLEAYTKAIELYPDHVSARNNIAVLLADDERFAETIPHYVENLKRGVTFVPAYGNLAIAYDSLGEHEKAAAVMEEAIRRFPESGTAHMQYGAHLWRVGKSAAALEELDRAETLRASSWQVASFRWLVHASDGNLDRADLAVRAIVASRDPFGRWLSNTLLARTELMRGRAAAAVKTLDGAVGVFPRSSEFTARTLWQQATILFELGDRSAAYARASAAAAAGRDTFAEAETLLPLVRASDAVGDRAGAQAAIERLKAIAEQPFANVERRFVHEAAAHLALARGDAPTAIRELTEAATLLSPRGFPLPPPRHVPVWYALATAHMAAGRSGEAERLFLRIVDATAEQVYWPVESTRSLYYLGQLADTAGDAARAENFYRRFVARWKDGDLDRHRVRDAQARLARTS